ncbi:replication-associated protein [Crucivirus-163]|nr:replication-associated protein [Crucivirus-163]
MSINPVTCFDFTAHGVEPDEAKKMLMLHCKKWDFQQEQGERTGAIHLQGRMWLKVKTRLLTIAKKFPGFHLSITSKANAKNSYYVSKEETRIAGPWSSDDKDVYVPRQVKEVKDLYPWQESIIKDASTWDTRHINIIIDKSGNIGKSTLCTYMGVYGIGRKIPYSNDFRDIMRMVMDTPVSRLYLFDLPKALKKEHLNQFFAGVEEIKNGYAYDDRYNFREKYFDCPNVWIFTNSVPDKNYLSADRWVLWEVGTTFQLNPYSPPFAPELSVDFSESYDISGAASPSDITDDMIPPNVEASPNFADNIIDDIDWDAPL